MGPVQPNDDDIMLSAMYAKLQYICLYIYIHVFHALCMIMYFGRSKCEASAGHGVILYQFGCAKLLFSEFIGQANRCVLIRH